MSVITALSYWKIWIRDRIWKKNYFANNSQDRICHSLKLTKTFPKLTLKENWDLSNMLKTVGLLTKHSPNAHSTSLFIFLQQKQQCRPQTLLSKSFLFSLSRVRVLCHPGDLQASSSQLPEQPWSDLAEIIKAWHVCYSSAQKKFFVQSLLPLCPLLSCLWVTLCYGVCVLCSLLPLNICMAVSHSSNNDICIRRNSLISWFLVSMVLRAKYAASSRFGLLILPHACECKILKRT